MKKGAKSSNIAAYSSMWVSGIPRKQISGKDSRHRANLRRLILAYCKFSRLYIEANKSVSSFILYSELDVFTF